MRVLIVSGNFPRPHDPLTGIWALQQAEALSLAGACVHVIAPTPWIPRLVQRTEKIRRWAQIPTQYRAGSLTVEAPKVPVIVTPLTRRWVYPYLPQADSVVLWRGLREEFSKTLAATGPQILLCHHTLPWGYLGLRVAQEFSIPYVLVEHSLVDTNSARLTRRRERVYREVVEGAAGLVAVGSAVRDSVLEMVPAMPAASVTVIPNGARTDDETRIGDAVAWQTGNDIEVLSVGSLTASKDHDLLIRAVAQIRRKYARVRLRIVGDGPRRSALQNLIQDLNLAGVVELVGSLSHSAVLTAMARCDIFALVSSPEAFGVVYGEAMSFGRPILACQEAGIADLVAHRYSAELVASNNLDETVAALERLVSDREYRAYIGENGRQVFLNELTWEHNARRVLQFLLERSPSKQTVAQCL